MFVLLELSRTFDSSFVTYFDFLISLKHFSNQSYRLHIILLISFLVFLTKFYIFQNLNMKWLFDLISRSLVVRSLLNISKIFTFSSVFFDGIYIFAMRTLGYFDLILSIVLFSSLFGKLNCLNYLYLKTSVVLTSFIFYFHFFQIYFQESLYFFSFLTNLIGFMVVYFFKSKLIAE